MIELKWEMSVRNMYVTNSDVDDVMWRVCGAGQAARLVGMRYATR